MSSQERLDLNISKLWLLAYYPLVSLRGVNSLNGLNIEIRKWNLSFASFMVIFNTNRNMRRDEKKTTFKIDFKRSHQFEVAKTHVKFKVKADLEANIKKGL